MMARIVVSVATALAACGYDVVIRRPGVVWVELDGSASAGGVTNRDARTECSALGMRDDGTVDVAWMDKTGGTEEIYLRSFACDTWTGLGGSDAPNGLSAGTGAATGGDANSCTGSLAYDRAGMPTIAWHNWFVDDSVAIYARRWNGASWLPIGASASGGGLSASTGVRRALWPRLVYDGADRPIVAWNGGSDVYVQVFDTTWAGLGGADQPGVIRVDSTAASQSVTWHTNQAWLGWVEDGGVLLKTWNGATWEGVGGSTAGISDAGAPASDVIVRGRVVAWSQASQVHVRTWDGSGWASLGAPTLADAGLSAADKMHPDMDIDDQGEPVVVWAEQDNLGVNIHGARWNDNAWRSIDPRAEGGISQTATTSRWPGVRASDSTVVVAWEEDLGSDVREIYVRASFE